MRLNETPLISELEIQARVRQLADEISAEYHDQPVLALVVLKGAAFFAADLLKRLQCELTVEFVRARSYTGMLPGDTVEFSHWPACDLRGKHILIVEDILDTGRTCQTLLDALQACEPASLKICALLDKPSGRVAPVTADYIGFGIEDIFVVGYGMDYNEAHRALRSVHELVET